MNVSRFATSVCAAIAIIGLGDAALAADLPAARPAYKAPVFALAAPYSWSGFYLGANLGYGWARASASVTGTGGFSGDASEDLNGGVFGVQAGYNWQFGQTVIGIETDFQGTTQKASQTATCLAATCGVDVTATRDSKLPWFGTTRLRLGYAFDRWLPYLTAGIAYGEHKTEVTASTATASGSSSGSETRAGLALGAGVEVGLAPNWSAKLEYLYLDSGTVTTTTAVSGYGTVTEDERLKNNIVRGGINYRF